MMMHACPSVVDHGPRPYGGRVPCVPFAFRTCIHHTVALLQKLHQLRSANGSGLMWSRA